MQDMEVFKMNLTADDRMALDMGEVLYKLDDAQYLLEVVLRWMEDEGAVGTKGREDAENTETAIDKLGVWNNTSPQH